MYPTPFSVCRWPKTIGRIALGSWKPTMLWPVIIATTA